MTPRRYIVALGIRPVGRSTWTGSRTNFPKSATWNNSGYAPPDPVQILSHYVLDSPILAGEFLAAAMARGEYLDALTHLQGTGLGSRAEQIHDGLHGRVIGPDLWAVVVYDGRDRGTRNPPYLAFGDARNARAAFDPPPMSSDSFMTPSEEGSPGVMNLTAAKGHAGALFLGMTTVANVRL